MLFRSKRMAYRLGTNKDARTITNADELTSRVSTTRLNETLDKLEKLTYSKDNVENKRRPSNILLATNMISVGIDVARLNVMLLVGQPKLTSEYIQASSRVGRSFPGVAFTMYDGSKSRDRSHYEQFMGYHESFYKHVEPTGVTPFSKPARDRALHAIVVALLRQLVPELTPENAAGKFTREKYKKEIDSIVEYIVTRNNDIINKINPGTDTEESEIREEIAAFLENWEKLEEGYEGDDRRQRRIQGGAVGAAVSRTRVPLKARSGRWAPQPVLAKRLAFFRFDFSFGVERGEQPLSRCGVGGVQRQGGGSRNTPPYLWPSGASPAERP